jgi:flagellar basal-body rod protein FlgC
MKDFFRILDLNASGLTAQRWRLNVLASNLANAESTRSPEGGPFRRKDVVFSAALQDFQAVLRAGADPLLRGVRVSGIVEDPRPPRLVYQPGHPDADPAGYVALPNVNPLEEMVNLLAAARSYEANVEMFNATKAMLLKALEIGRV